MRARAAFSAETRTPGVCTVCLMSTASMSAEQIAAAGVLTIRTCMRAQACAPKYPIVLANEAARYLSARNLQVPSIFSTVWF